MTFLKRIFNKEVSKMQNSEAAREELPPIDQPYIFSPTKKNSKYLKKGILPRHYEKGLNCFLDSIDDPGIRQAAYEELLMTPGGLTLDLSREAGALFGVKNLIVCTDIYNKAAQRLNKPEVAAYGIPKKGIVRLMLEGSKMKMTFIFKPQMLPSGRMIGHAESHGPTDIVLDSQDFFERGLACQKRGETKQSLDWYNRAIETEALDARAWLNKGAILAEQNDFQAAIKCFDEVIDIAPAMSHGIVWLNKAYVLREIKEYEESIACLDEALKINSGRFETWNSRAQTLIELKRYDEALNCLDRAIEVASSEPILWRNKADLLWFRGKYVESVESCDQALKINSKNADVWNIKGLDLLKLKEYEEALKCYNNALEFSPNFDEAWLNKSEVLAIKGKLSEAVKCAERAIEINPNRTDRWKVLGDLALKLSDIGKHTDALKYIDKSLQLEPLNSTLWNNKAAILMSLNKFAESEECSERALDINPKSAAAWLNKGSALLNLVKIEVEKGSKDVNGNFLKYFKLGMKLDPAVTNILPSQVKDFANDLSRLEQRDLGEDYAYKLLVNTPKYLQKPESETDNQFARKWTVIALGLFNRRFKLMFEGNPLEVERLELYQEVIEHALSDTFRDYENNPRQGFHVNTPNANYGIGKWVSELFPCDEDAQFENTISVLSDSLLPVLLPLIPDIKQELGKENEYDDKFNTAIPDVISILHENLCLLREEKQILKEHVYSQLKEYLLKRYFLEHHIENLKSTEKKIWVASVNALIEMGGIISMNDVVIKTLFDTLKNENNDIKAKIAYILSEIGKTALTPALEALREENKEIQTHAIYILSKIGEPALKPLTALIDDENEIVRQLANICLEKIYEDSKNNSANEQ